VDDPSQFYLFLGRFLSCRFPLGAAKIAVTDSLVGVAEPPWVPGFPNNLPRFRNAVHHESSVLLPRFWYIKSMRTKSLKETNPYLKTLLVREKGLWSSVLSSSAIEGVHVAKEKVTGPTVISPHKPEEFEKSRH
jgi:hypothetical protein